jgi:hypothetical protein
MDRERNIAQLLFKTALVSLFSDSTYTNKHTVKVLNSLTSNLIKVSLLFDRHEGSLPYFQFLSLNPALARYHVSRRELNM